MTFLYRFPLSCCIASMTLWTLLWIFLARTVP